MASRSPRRDAAGVFAACLLAGSAACAPSRVVPESPLLDASPAPEPLPPLPAPRISLVGPSAAPLAPGDPLAAVSSLQTVTLRAQDVEVRALLAALAETAGISLVLDPGVEGRMSVHLVDVPVADALREVLAAANLSVATPAAVAPWGPALFYATPVDIERASAELIQSRIGVSPAVARWIVENRR